MSNKWSCTPTLSFFLLLLGFAALTGCEQAESADIRTSGIYLDGEIRATGNGKSVVNVWLRVGGPASNTMLDLSDGDTLTVSGGGETKTMRAVDDPIFNSIRYTATLSTEAADTEIVVSLSRSGDDSAPRSTVTLPGPFQLEQPADGSTFSRSQDDLTVQWSPSGTSDTMYVTVDGECIQPHRDDLASDPGTLTLGAGTIRHTQDDQEQEGAEEEDEPQTCPASVYLRRKRSGSVDSALGGGKIWAVQERSASITTTP